MRKILILSLAMSIGLTASFAASSHVGTSGAQFLRIGASARPTGMGEAFAGIADDANAVYYNPAGIAFLERPELTAMHAQWFLDMNYEYGAFAFPTEYGAFGVQAATLKVEDHVKRGLDESNQGTFNAMDAAYGISYARAATPWLSFGGTVRFIDQEIDTAQAEAWSGDVGTMVKIRRIPLSIGLAVKHFGEKLRFVEESDPQPLTVDLGFGTSLFRDKLLFGLDFIKVRDTDLEVAVGGEWRQKLMGEFRYALRTGYNSIGTDADGANGLAVGGGIGFKQFDLDFAWVPLGDLGNTFRYAAVVKF